ncbi:MAG: hypothetical protein PHQ59_00485 [Candidatus Daviesbacteria bacterium]|nr:hypothetical protein [Candidatus Daviesbacteria bacterium]
MVNNTVPEVPVINKQEPLAAPLKPGADHPQLINETRQAVAKQLVTPVQNVTPSNEVQQQMVQNDVDTLLEAVGAPAVEENQATEKPSGKMEEFTKNVVAFVPFGETDREGDADNVINLQKIREEKRAA